MTVTPLQNTTYTISATGPGGTATANVAVTVTQPAPTVSISANPVSIEAGQSTTLAWSSTHAETVAIDQGIGSVSANGSISVAPAQNTIYTITATGAGGTANASTTVTVSTISLQITSPLQGDLVTGPDVMVRGVITRQTVTETAVLVNGVIADVYGDEFVANEVPLQQGQSSIIAVATEIHGNTASASTTVQASAEEHYIRLHAVDYSGVSPLETTLRADATFGFTNPRFSCTGPGEVEFLESSDPNEREIRITGEGTYQFTVEATDAQGRLYSDTVAIVALSRDQVDGLLKAKWNQMKQRLGEGAIEEALGGFRQDSREKYRTIFNAIAYKLPGIVSAMQDIEMVECRSRTAEYRIDRLHSIDGEPATITYSLFFRVDTDGFWRIDEF